MTPEELNRIESLTYGWNRSGLTQYAEEVAANAFSLIKEVRRLQEVEAASRLFGMVVPPCDCGAYENSTKPCSANCRIDVRFRTAIGGEAQVSP